MMQNANEGHEKTGTHHDFTIFLHYLLTGNFATTFLATNHVHCTADNDGSK
jgi:hypothetical protein